MALLELEKLRKDINILFGYVRCLMSKSDETSPLVATEWSANHATGTGNPYTAGTYVFYNGHVYKCKFNNDGIIPTNTTYWLDLGEGHLLAEEQSDWNATGGRTFILNKPTNTSDFVNDGEDGSSPYVTQDELVEALEPSYQTLDEVLQEGDISITGEPKVKSIGLYDDFVAPFGFAKIYANKSRFYFADKLGNIQAFFSQSALNFIKGLYTFTINTPILSNNRTATFQDKSGVIAYLSDIRNIGLYSQTEESAPVTGTTESTLIGAGQGTLSVPADAFQVGDSFHLRVSGKLTNANASQLIINLKADGVAIGTTSTLTLPATTDKNWELTAEFTIRAIGPAGTAILQTCGKFVYNKNSSNAFEGQIFDFTEVSNFDTTISNTLNVTATWLTNNVANTIHSHSLTLNKIY